MARAALLDRPETVAEVDAESGCVACEYVRKHCVSSPSGVFFVLVTLTGSIELRRVEQLDAGGQVFLCVGLTEQAAHEEISKHEPGEA